MPQRLQSSAARARTEEFIPAPVREAQTRISPAPDFTVGNTDQAWEYFLTHTRKPGRTRSRTLRTRDPEAEGKPGIKVEAPYANLLLLTPLKDFRVSRFVGFSKLSALQEGAIN